MWLYFWDWARIINLRLCHWFEFRHTSSCNFRFDRVNRFGEDRFLFRVICNRCEVLHAFDIMCGGRVYVCISERLTSASIWLKASIDIYRFFLIKKNWIVCLLCRSFQCLLEEQWSHTIVFGSRYHHWLRIILIRKLFGLFYLSRCHTLLIKFNNIRPYKFKS